MTEMHTVSILFSKGRDRVSNGLYWVTGRKYTHVSLRLDELGEDFYSFNIKGFCTEKPYRFNEARTERSALYQFQISDEAFCALRERLQAFLARRDSYRYDGVGVALCIAHIRHRTPNAYFCSQFVAELLRDSGALPLRRHPSVCLPNALERELWACGMAKAARPDPYRDLPAARPAPARQPGLAARALSLWRRMLPA